ncbi:MAG: four helix bundle protein [Bacteroidales bacterium]|nr:four helix bundle protein [Bacteroidales bacterium]
MKAERFEDIVIWQNSKKLAVIIYKLFEHCKDFGLKDQILRASVSIMNNIAEGFERSTNNEFKHFLFIAKGSCGELRSMLYLAKETQKISDSEFKELYNSSIEISKMLSGFIKKL